MDDEQLLESASGFSSRSKRSSSCPILGYRLLVVSLLFAVLGLQIASFISKDEKKDEGNQCHSSTLIEKLGGPLNMSGLPETCGSLKPLPERLPNTTFRLRQVQVVIRHGDRTQWKPTPCYGSSATWNCDLSMQSTPSFSRSESNVDIPRTFRHYYLSSGEPFAGDCSVGQLTKTGFHQEVQNGMYLRNAYVENSFLSATYDRSEIYIKSDDVHRTIQSAEGLFYGLYPPDFCTQQPVDVVDIHMVDVNTQTMYPNENVCPKYAALLNESKSSSAFREHFTNSTEPLLGELGPLLNATFDSADDLDFLVDCFRVHLCHRFSLPSGMTDELVRKAEEELAWAFNYLYTYPTREIGCKAAIGYLAQDIHNRMKSFIDGKDQTKFILYSGHDTSILPLLNLFQLDNTWPPYASRLTFELYEHVNEPGTHEVRILYNGNVMTLPFCNNASTCPWKATFSPYVEKFIPTKEFCFN